MHSTVLFFGVLVLDGNYKEHTAFSPGSGYEVEYRLVQVRGGAGGYEGYETNDEPGITG